MRLSFLGLHRLVVLTVICFAAPVDGFGQDTLGDRVHAFADEEVNRYQISLASDGVALVRVPRSLLRWSTVTRVPAFGDSYIWTHQGCPRAIVSIYAMGPPNNFVSIECQSLSETPLVMRRDGIEIWTPSQSGLSRKPVDNVPPPGETATSRLVQMNAIARRFRAEIAFHTAPGEFTWLRLLSKPLFRYASENENVIDGAVYGFVEATDPELLLVIEARRQNGVTSWVYSPARSRHDHMRLYLGSELVWDSPTLAPPWKNLSDPNKPYFNVHLKALAKPSELEKLSEILSGTP